MPRMANQVVLLNGLRISSMSTLAGCGVNANAILSVLIETKSRMSSLLGVLKNKSYTQSLSIKNRSGHLAS